MLILRNVFDSYSINKCDYIVHYSIVSLRVRPIYILHSIFYEKWKICNINFFKYLKFVSLLKQI